MGEHLISNYSVKRLDKMIKDLEPKRTINAPIHQPALYRGKQHEIIPTPAINKFIQK